MGILEASGEDQSELKEQTPQRFKKMKETRKTHLPCKGNVPILCNSIPRKS